MSYEEVELFLQVVGEKETKLQIGFSPDLNVSTNKTELMKKKIILGTHVMLSVFFQWYFLNEIPEGIYFCRKKLSRFEVVVFSP